MSARVFLASAVGLGIVLRLVQYIAAVSLRVDEAMLALNIVSRSASALVFSPLEYGQVAPPLYLLAAKAAVLIGGPNELALRLPAFLSSIASLLLFAVIAKRYLVPCTAAIAVTLFAISPMLVQFGAETKQYSGDVLATVLLTYMALEIHQSRYSSRPLRIAIIVAPLVVWASQASVIVITGLGAGLVVLAILERRDEALWPLLALATSWVISSVASLFVGLRSMTPTMKVAMQDYWAYAFLPWQGGVSEKLFWLGRSLRDVYVLGLGFRRVGGLCVIISIAGLLALWNRGRRDLAVLISAPIIVTIVASAAHQYPFSGRATLFLLPAFAIIFAAGVSVIVDSTQKLVPMAQFAVIPLLLLPPFYVISRYHPPWYDEEVKPVLAHIASNRQPGDDLYVFYGAVPAMRFYGERYGFDTLEWSEGLKHRGEPREYLRELDRFRGHERVWVMFSHDVVTGERETILGYLTRIGVQLTASGYPKAGPLRPDAVTFLFDLSDARAPSRAIPGDKQPAH